MLCLCAAQLKFWSQTDLGRKNSASCYRQGRQLLLTFLTMFTRWSRSTSNFNALIGRNLTGEFMRKIYAASWNLLTLTAETDREFFKSLHIIFRMYIIMSETFIKIDSMQHLEILRQTYPTNRSKIRATKFTVLTLCQFFLINTVNTSIHD